MGRSGHLGWELRDQGVGCTQLSIQSLHLGYSGRNPLERNGRARLCRVEHLLALYAFLEHGQLCIRPNASHFILKAKLHLLLSIVMDFLRPNPSLK